MKNNKKKIEKLLDTLFRYVYEKFPDLTFMSLIMQCSTNGQEVLPSKLVV